jgi:flagellar hook-basal body protein
LDANIGGGGGTGFVLTADTVNTGVIGNTTNQAGSGYLRATGYVHATTGTGYLHAATGTGYLHTTTGTGYVHGFTGTGYLHGLTGTGYVHELTGTGYTHPLLFQNVELTGGAGNGARADITVNSLGEVTDVNLIEGGYGYAADDVLTVSGAALGVDGAGFQVPIASLKSGIKSLQNITGVTSGGTGYIDGIYKDVPLTGGSGTGAMGTVEISNGIVNNVILTDGGSGYLTTDILSVNTSSVGGGIGSGFTTAVGSTNTLQGSGAGTRGATYNLRLADGTNLSITQVSESGNGTPKYVVNVDRFSVFATLDGNAVGSNSTANGKSTIKVGGVLTEEQTSLGTMAFVGGKNLDSLSRDAFGKPQFDTRFTIDASGGKGSGWGQTTNGGVVQFTLNSTDMTAYSSAAQAYKNDQDGSATSQLASYSVDSSGQLVAQYDNGQSVVKGQLILAYFNNQEGLIPNGNNTFEASSESGEPLLSFPGDGTLGSIRSKALEQSNVDLTAELVKLMVLQRQYSAVSQATKVMAATLIDDAINIGR